MPLSTRQGTLPETAVVDAPTDAARAQQELADVFIYLVRLAAVLGIDLEAAVEAKLQVNAQKYPIALAHGNAIKSSRRADD